MKPILLIYTLLLKKLCSSVKIKSDSTLKVMCLIECHDSVFELNMFFMVINSVSFTTLCLGGMDGLLAI